MHGSSACTSTLKNAGPDLIRKHFSVYAKVTVAAEVAGINGFHATEGLPWYHVDGLPNLLIMLSSSYRGVRLGF